MLKSGKVREGGQYPYAANSISRHYEMLIAVPCQDGTQAEKEGAQSLEDPRRRSVIEDSEHELIFSLSKHKTESVSLERQEIDTQDGQRTDTRDCRGACKEDAERNQLRETREMREALTESLRKKVADLNTTVATYERENISLKKENANLLNEEGSACEFRLRNSMSAAQQSGLLCGSGLDHALYQCVLHRKDETISSHEEQIRYLEKRLESAESAVKFAELPLHPRDKLFKAKDIIDVMAVISEEIKQVLYQDDYERSVSVPETILDCDLAMLLSRGLGSCAPSGLAITRSSQLSRFNLQTLIRSIVSAGLCDWVFYSDFPTFPGGDLVMAERYRARLAIRGESKCSKGQVAHSH